MNADTCSGKTLDLNICNSSAVQSPYGMRFTSCQNNLPIIKSISNDSLTLNSDITITGNHITALNLRSYFR